MDIYKDSGFVAFYDLLIVESGADVSVKRWRKSKSKQSYEKIVSRIDEITSKAIEIIARLEEFEGTHLGELPIIPRQAIIIFSSAVMYQDFCAYVDRKYDASVGSIKKAITDGINLAGKALKQRLEKEDFSLPTWFNLRWERGFDPTKTEEFGFCISSCTILNAPLVLKFLSGEISYFGVAWQDDEQVTGLKYKNQEYMMSTSVLIKLLRNDEVDEEELDGISDGIKPALIAKLYPNKTNGVANWLLSMYGNGLKTAIAEPEPTSPDIILDNRNVNAFVEMLGNIQNFNQLEKLLSLTPTAFSLADSYDKTVVSEMPHIFASTHGHSAYFSFASLLLMEMFRYQEAYKAHVSKDDELSPEFLFERAKFVVTNEVSNIQKSVETYSARLKKQGGR